MRWWRSGTRSGLWQRHCELGPGNKQPDFTLDLHGTSQPYDLYSNLSGKIVVLDFFTEWCESCNIASSELEPFVQQYYASLGGNPAKIPVQVVSINEDTSAGDLAATNAYITKYGLPLVLDDPSGTSSTITIMAVIRNSPLSMERRTRITSNGT